MDPDANWEETQRLACEFLSEYDQDTGDHDEEKLLEKAARLSELVTALDEWMTKGGFPPKAWKSAGK